MKAGDRRAWVVFHSRRNLKPDADTAAGALPRRLKTVL
jgi:hypothetical protein